MFCVYFNVGNFVMYPKMPLHLLKGGKTSRRKQSSARALINLEMSNIVIWDNGPSGQCVHDSCRLTLSSYNILDQAKQRQKRIVANTSLSMTPSTSYSDLSVEALSYKRLWSSLGVIHDKTKCLWCCKGESKKHPETRLILLSYDYAWAAFKSHTVAVEDQVMGDQINCMIDSAVEQPSAIEIRYHLKCWLKYVRSYQKMNDDDKLPRMQNVTHPEPQTVFFITLDQLSLMNMSYNHCKVSSKITKPLY